MHTIHDLLAIMAKLRDPNGGCPWDLEQNFDTIAPYTIEEAYEVEDAIKRKDFQGLKEELGDLLLQVVFHAQMAKEAHHFDFEQVVNGVCEKMIKRHPHVFGDADIQTAEAQTESWEQQKAEERRQKSAASGMLASVLDGVATNLPALIRAEKLTKRAAKVGFDWHDAEQILDKLDEEIDELEVELEIGGPKEKLMEELGDMLFVVVNLARHLNVDPEEALRFTNRKFEKRFRYIETRLAAQGKDIETTPLEEMENLWDEAKIAEVVQ